MSANQCEGLSRVALVSLHASPLARLGKGKNGGLNVFIRQLGQELSYVGIFTDIFTYGNSDDFGEIDISDQLRVINVPRLRGSSLWENPRLHAEYFSTKLEEFSRKHHICYELVYSHYWLSGWACYMSISFLNAPWVHTFHTLGLVKMNNNYDSARLDPEERIYVEKLICSEADALVALSDKEKSSLINLYKVPSHKVEVVPAGVDLSLFSPLSKQKSKEMLGVNGSPVLLFVGRLDPIKGADRFLAAVSVLRRKYPSIRALVVGDEGEPGTGELERLKSVAAELRILENVSFAGPIEHRSLPLYYSAADVLVMPSYAESFGLVALEALACGCPVVGCDVGIIEKIVTNINVGLICKSGEPACIAKAAELVLQNSSNSHDATLIRRRIATNFTWQRTAESVLTLVCQRFNKNLVVLCS